MLHPDLLHRLEQARLQVDAQGVVCRRLRRESKVLRAAASAAADRAVAVKLATLGLLNEPTPPIPTHPPKD